MVKWPTGSGGEPSSPNCVASAGGKARQPHSIRGSRRHASLHRPCAAFRDAWPRERRPCTVQHVAVRLRHRSASSKTRYLSMLLELAWSCPVGIYARADGQAGDLAAHRAAAAASCWWPLPASTCMCCRAVARSAMAVALAAGRRGVRVGSVARAVPAASTRRRPAASIVDLARADHAPGRARSAASPCSTATNKR